MVLVECFSDDEDIDFCELSLVNLIWVGGRELYLGLVEVIWEFSSIMGMVVGIVVVVVLCIFIFFYVMYKYRNWDEGLYYVDESWNYISNLV